jgi:DNA topoisomerase IB
MLGNTPAICRKCYIHPAVFDGYLDGSLLQALKRRADAKLANPRAGLKAEEVAVMGFLSRQLAATDRVSLRQPRARRQPPATIVVFEHARRNRESKAARP